VQKTKRSVQPRVPAGITSVCCGSKLNTASRCFPRRKQRIFFVFLKALQAECMILKKTDFQWECSFNKTRQHGKIKTSACGYGGRSLFRCRGTGCVRSSSTGDYNWKMSPTGFQMHLILDPGARNARASSTTLSLRCTTWKKLWQLSLKYQTNYGKCV